MREPTKAQRAMLERLAGGDVIYFLSGHNAHAFYSPSMFTARMDVVHACWKRGWIEDGTESRTYTLAPAGRAALQTKPGER